MATNDVPGANAANRDELHAGCWAEHDDSSLLFVKSGESDTVVFELYDMMQSPPVYYQNAMRIAAFKTKFSYPPVGQSAEKWTWHDKTAFPWDRVIKNYPDSPTPQFANVADTLSAAARVAASFQEKVNPHVVNKEQIEARTEQIRSHGRPILDRLMSALAAFKE